MAKTSRTTTEQAVIQSEREFRDPRWEWRRLFAEFIGTWLTTIVILGARAIGVESGGEVTTAMGFTARGLMTMGAILFLGTISGAHLNPAVTFGFALRGNFPWPRVPGYLAASLPERLQRRLWWPVYSAISSVQARQHPERASVTGKPLPSR